MGVVTVCLVQNQRERGLAFQKSRVMHIHCHALEMLERLGDWMLVPSQGEAKPASAIYPT